MFDTAADASGEEPKHDAMPTMGFLDHLEELRRRLVYSIAAVAVGFFACWGYRKESTASCRSRSWTPSKPTACRKNWSI